MKSSKLTLLFLFVPFIVFAQNKSIKPQPLPKGHPGSLITITQDFESGTMDGYNLYVPNSCHTQSEKYPVLVFLQGGLGVGGDVDKLLQWALPQMIMEDSSLKTELDRYLRDTFIVVMPHIDGGEFFNNEDTMRQILKDVMASENVDPDRIYLTGLSRGGFGAWGLASSMSDVFAAVAPICGGPRGVGDYEALASMPIWVSHNTEDAVVRYHRSERGVNQLESQSEVRFHHSSSIASADYENHNYIFTSRESDSHNAWTEMYGASNFYKWLLRFEK
ncbi:PHB depolymerase family esterase [Aureisphaera galaxeae]|uniref:carboxylesterase family protein n=1 Tax=Aureisphaera galaxeae TaxID=1538023 RepID=UPI00235042A4|nr:PHB depolymerase family esterase [Aureisphaera galaxeae]MDC8003995.1 PHB depolymerase family esterase [Aureisphaera galaxeae]